MALKVKKPLESDFHCYNTWSILLLKQKKLLTFIRPQKCEKYLVPQASSNPNFVSFTGLFADEWALLEIRILPNSSACL